MVGNGERIRRRKLALAGLAIGIIITVIAVLTVRAAARGFGWDDWLLIAAQATIIALLGSGLQWLHRWERS